MKKMKRRDTLVKLSHDLGIELVNNNAAVIQIT